MRTVKALYFSVLGLGLGAQRSEKNGPPSRVAVVELENIETVHAPKHIQAAGALCMDRFAVLWSVLAAHRLRGDGSVYAIKVSMS